MAKLTHPHKPDFILLGVLIALVLFGLLMVFNASPVTSLRDFGDPYFLIKQQIIWAIIGLALGLVAFKINYHFWGKVSPLLLLIGIIMLLAVFIPGLGFKIYGAQRWLKFGFFTLQPAEFIKLAYIVFLSSILAKKVRFLPFAVITGLICSIVLRQDDFGTTAIIALMGGAIYFLSGAPLLQIITLVPAGLGIAAFFILTSDYRRERFLTFLNPSADPQGAAYQINQILIALGSGGIFGVGLGASRQKYGFIPEVTTDSIFAVVGNEVGFIGSMIVLLTFLFIVYRGFKIARFAPDKFGGLLAIGVASWIGLQTFFNLAGMSSLLPLTGVPLPFISYGGSSLVTTIVASAILLNISRYTKSTSNSLSLSKK